MIAAIGDWNIEDMAPADAQAINKDLVFASIWKNRPKLELIAAPDSIAGPNSPTDPPKPTVRGAANKGEYIFYPLKLLIWKSILFAINFKPFLQILH